MPAAAERIRCQNKTNNLQGICNIETIINELIYMYELVNKKYELFAKQFAINIKPQSGYLRTGRQERNLQLQ